MHNEMKNMRLVCCWMLGFVAVAAQGGVPALQSGTNVYDGAAWLNVGVGSLPFVVDWNNDGKKDLLVGTKDGKVRLYLNQGTAASPVFSGFSYIQDAGGVISLPYSDG